MTEKLSLSRGAPFLLAVIVRCIGVRAGGARGAAAPPKFGQLRFFGQQEKFGQSQFLKKFPCFFFEEIDIFYFNLESAW